MYVIDPDCKKHKLKAIKLEWLVTVFSMNKAITKEQRVGTLCGDRGALK